MIQVLGRFLVALALLISTAGVAPAQTAQTALRHLDPASPSPSLTAQAPPAQALDRLRAASPVPVRAEIAPGSDHARVIRFEGEGLRVGKPDTPIEARAVAFLERHGDAFGLPRAAEMVVRGASVADEVGMRRVRLQQTVAGLPVTGGEMIVHFRGDAVVSARGKSLTDAADVARIARWAGAHRTEADALRIVRNRLEKHLGHGDFELSEPRLEVLNRGLLENRRAASHVAWYVEATALDLRERFWVDDETGGVLLQFSQLAHAKNRQVYDAGSTNAIPGTLQRSEGNAATGDSDIDFAYEYAGHTYDYFLFEHGRDSFDDAGAPMISTVRYCPSASSCPYANAGWTGTQMIYGEGYASGDDVVAHELTHAVIDYSANLYYYMQSGALNESFADIFGEVVDQNNQFGNDVPSVRWQMGEDLPIGAIRDMSNPNAYGDPGSLNDANYFYCADPGGDAGGVHVNSGVPNHAFVLMSDGGSFGGQTVNGIGTAKAAKIAYRALTEYLISSSDFFDAYEGFKSSCQDLVGSGGITAADCTEVGKALDAVDMGEVWPCAPTRQIEAPLCGAGEEPDFDFLQDFEDGGVLWSVSTFAGQPGWVLGNTFATSPVNHLRGYDLGSTNDSAVGLSLSFPLPVGAKLHFRHSFGFETFGATAYDGGVIEYSLDGNTWLDAGGLIDAGTDYVGTLHSSNPMGARQAFVADSYGYVSTRLDLSSFAGQFMWFRFRIGSDTAVNDYGWFIDDVRIYDCAVSNPLIFSDGFEAGNLSAWSLSIP